MAELTLERGLRVLETRARVVSYTIVAYMVVAGFMVLVTLGLLGGQIHFDETVKLDALSAFASLAAVAYLVVFITSAILVSTWIYRAHANLRAANLDGLEFTPGWSVGWFFVPVVNLFKPFQAMRELWNCSHGQSDGFAQETPPELAPWWGCYVIGGFFDNMSTRIHLGDEAAYVLNCIGLLLLLGSGWFLLQIVRKVTRAQVDHLQIGHTFA